MKQVNNNSWTSVVTPPHVFLDIGVGVKNSEAWRARKAWPKARIIGFEPNANRYKSLNKVFPGELIQCAVGCVDESVEMCQIDGMSVRFPRTHQRGKNVTTRSRSLDSLDKELGPFKNVFIWADTEGSELEILKGSVGLLESGRVVGLNLELWKKLQVKNWCLDSQVKEFLVNYGFVHTHDWPGPKTNHYDAIFTKP